MISKGWRSSTNTEQAVAPNCSACGRSLEQIQTMPRHAPDPQSEAERCHSRPKKYDHLQCMYATGHECAHTANVTGTGKHFWSDSDAA